MIATKIAYKIFKLQLLHWLNLTLEISNADAWMFYVNSGLHAFLGPMCNPLH